jgi:hypothetical protein
LDTRTDCSGLPDGPAQLEIAIINLKTAGEKQRCYNDASSDRLPRATFHKTRDANLEAP